MKKILFFLLLTGFAPLFLCGEELPWRRGGDGGEAILAAPEDGVHRATVKFPGSTQLYREEDRRTFRPNPASFARRALRVEVRRRSGSPVKVNLFVKDKEGRFFNSDAMLELKDDAWHALEVRIDEAARNWRPIGHRADWSAHFACAMFSAGLNLYGSEAGEAEIEWRNFCLVGERERPPLALLDWTFPEDGEVYEVLKSTFRLSREYFNVFDTEEIAVDFIIRYPDGAEHAFPAYYELPHRRTRHFTQERVEPVGTGNWAFRFTPPAPGKYSLQIHVRDLSNRSQEVALRSAWKEINVRPSFRTGFVRVSPKNLHYFELSSGEFFFPIGLNIHTNIDLRSEFRLKFEELPDQGTFDYDDYFAACGKAGINVVEVWMAAWTIALEWSSARPDYYGLGRYHLGNAWRLDHLLETARKHGIRLNLVLDNHGKTSVHSDMEWAESPFNSESPHALANGAFLRDAEDFFRNEEVRKYNAYRNRYIAARWGADPAIMAIELWSEVDLTHKFRDRYSDDTAITWHAEVAREYRKMSQGPHMVTTHVCGDYKNNLTNRKLFDLPEMSHVAGDAYRGNKVHFADQVALHGKNLVFPKPILITEFGGPSSGAGVLLMIADIHAGLWSSIFHKQAGAPFLWWHDFVHLGGHYAHYRGLANFMKNVDLRDWSLRSRALRIWRPEFGDMGKLDASASALAPSLGAPGPLLPRVWPAFAFKDAEWRFDGLALASPREALGWVFCYAGLRSWTGRPGDFPLVSDLAFALDAPLEAGSYRVEYFDTLTGEVVNELVFEHKGGPLKLPLPPFRLDVAFKVRKENANAVRSALVNRPPRLYPPPTEVETIVVPQEAVTPPAGWHFANAEYRIELERANPEAITEVDLRRLLLPELLKNGVEVVDASSNVLSFRLTENDLLQLAPGGGNKVEVYFGFALPRALNRWPKAPAAHALTFSGKRQNGPVSEAAWIVQQKERLRNNYTARWQNEMKSLWRHWMELSTAPHFFVQYPQNGWQVGNNYRARQRPRDLRIQRDSGLLRPNLYRLYYQHSYPVKSYFLSVIFYQNLVRWGFSSLARIPADYAREQREVMVDAFNVPQRELREVMENRRRPTVGSIPVMDISIPTRPFDVGGNMALRFSGRLFVPSAGKYVFRIQSQSLAILSIDSEDVLVIQEEKNAGHSSIREEETTLELSAGLHDFRLDFQRHDDSKWISAQWRPSGDKTFRLLSHEDFRPGLPLSVTGICGRDGKRYPVVFRRDDVEFFSGKLERLVLETYELRHPRGASFTLFRDGAALCSDAFPSALLPRPGETAPEPELELRVAGKELQPLRIRRSQRSPLAHSLPLALNLRCFFPRFLHDDQTAELFVEAESPLAPPLSARLIVRTDRETGALRNEERVLHFPGSFRDPENRFNAGSVFKQCFRAGGAGLRGGVTNVSFALEIPGIEFSRRALQFVPVAKLPRDLTATPEGLFAADGITQVIPLLHRLTLSELREWEVLRAVDRGMQRRRHFLVLGTDWCDAEGNSFQDALRTKLEARGIRLSFVNWDTERAGLLTGLPSVLAGIRQAAEADTTLLLSPPGTLLQALPAWDREDIVALVAEYISTLRPKSELFLATPPPAKDSTTAETESAQAEFLRRFRRQRGLNLLEFALRLKKESETAPVAASRAAEILLELLH